MEDQTSLMDKIHKMNEWLDKHRSDDDHTPMTSSQRKEFIDRLSNVSKRKQDAKAILEFFQRGQVFDMPKELEDKS